VLIKPGAEMEITPGQKWRKLDLHLHTPASHDWAGGEISPEEFVQAALDQEVDGIAVTDHNTANWIDRIKEAAASTSLIVFPGVEITANGGTGGIHIIALFDPSTNESTVNDLLAKAEISTAERGKPESLSSKSVIELIELIYNSGALPILAHANSSKGALCDMRGQQRINLVNDPRVASVEVSDTQRYRSLLDGSDNDYRRPLPIHRASDNPAAMGTGHSLEGIASKYSFFKMDEINLDGLRQCFYDPDIRIRTDEDLSPLTTTVGPLIKSVSVSQGFLNGTYQFHEGLNCVVGGKGVGKSLLVEAIRFGLNQESELEEIQRDHDSKLQKRFGLGCEVEINIVSKSGQEFRVTRIFDAEANPTHVIKPNDNSVYDGEIDTLFPIMAYSQTEAVEIARDETAQLSLVDRLLDLSSLFRELRNIQERLSILDQEFANCISETEKCELLKKEIASLEEKIAEIDRQLGSGEHSNYNRMLNKKDFLDKHTQKLSDWKLSIQTIKENIEADELPDFPEELHEDDLSKEFDTLAVSNKTEIQSSIQQSIDSIETKIQKLNNLREGWDSELETAKKAYEEWAKQAGGDAPTLTKNREQLVFELKELKENLSSSKAIAEKASDFKTKRNQQLDDLDSVKDKIFQLRSEKYNGITEATGARLRLTLAKSGNREKFEERLIEICRGTHIRQLDLRELAYKIDPREFGRILLEDDATKLVEITGIDETLAERVLEGVRESLSNTDILGLQHENLMDDAPTIELKKQDGSYGELSELSIGQKSSALLMIALTDNDSPILIDQPEDALDLASVFEDITTPIRNRKDQRQFILTTHNPTVAVAGDADRFQVLKATSSTTEIAAHGAIEREDVREEIILHLEGGNRSFELKTKKYKKYLKN
jgi:DNA repair ATPase RecN